jgi:molecular chaperone DnaK
MIVGIDLGTTFSAVSHVQEGVPRILSQGDERIMPSMVGLTPQGGLLVGTPARNQYTLYPERTIRSIKRKMGTNEQVTLGDRSYAPAEISALILRELKRRAETQLGETVDRAVITVPAYFSDAARQATIEAGQLAGFTVERILNEPTAAALAYGLDRSDERQLVAVYDLGGGTFDVSIIELDNGVVEVRASHGDTQLGGDDFDQRLVDFLAERFLEQHPGHDPRADRRALARLTRAAEQAKIALSSQAFTRVREEYLLSEGNRPLHLDIEVARTDFEGLIEDLVSRTLDAFAAALEDTGLEASAMNKILLVGGSTRVPLVWQRVYEYTGIEPEIAVNPDEAVALGAGVEAAIIAGEPLAAILVDVTAHSLGIEVAEEVFGRLVPDLYSIIIHRNTTIPTSKSEVYRALTPQQTAIELKIYQGEEQIASRNRLLGNFLFSGLRPEAPGQLPRITVTFDFDSNGILHVSAVDRGSGKTAGIQVQAAHARLSAAELADARLNLEALEEDLVRDLEGAVEGEWTEVEAGEPQANGAGSDEHAEASALLARARRLLEREPDDQDLREAIESLTGKMREDDEAAIEAAQEALLDLIYDREE